MSKAQAALLDALTQLVRHFPTDFDMKQAGWGAPEIDRACNAYDVAKNVLERAALAAEAQPDTAQPALDDDELRDMAGSACQEALSFGVSEDAFMKLARSVRQRCATPAQPAAVPAPPEAVITAAAAGLAVAAVYEHCAKLCDELHADMAGQGVAGAYGDAFARRIREAAAHASGQQGAQQSHAQEMEATATPATWMASEA